MLERVLLLLGGIEIVLGGLMTAYPNLLPQWVGLVVAGIGLLTVSAALYLLRKTLWEWLLSKARADAEAKLPAQGVALPITITAIERPFYWRHSGLKTMSNFTDDTGVSKEREVESPVLRTKEIFISNNSLNRAVTLRFSLVITDNRGKTHKLSGEGKDLFGKILGKHDTVATSFAVHGIDPPRYILSPVSIPPQTTARGILTFIITSIIGGRGETEDKILAYYLDGSTRAETGFKYQLELEDVMSGTVISIPLPSDGYRGGDA